MMVDSMVGNDYSFVLCSNLKSSGVDIQLVVTEDRIVKAPVNFSVIKLLPSKDRRRSKIMKTFKYLRYLFMLSYLIKKNNIDVVHYQFFRRVRMESLFYYFLRLTGTSLVHSVHDVLPFEKKKADRFFNDIIYKASKALIVHTDYIKQRLLKNFQIANTKVKIIPHGNFDIYLPKEKLPRTQAREQLGLEEKDNVLLFFGNIKKYKGLDLLLDAFEIAWQTNQVLKLVIAGLPDSRELDQSYIDKINSLSCKDNIIYHGKFIPSEMVASYFVAADAVALPYRDIYHSGILHLAYSFGKPCLATRVGDFSETIEEGKSGYVVTENNAEEFANIILKTYSNESKLREMGKYARELSDTKYSWVTIAEDTKELYAKCATASN